MSTLQHNGLMVREMTGAWGEMFQIANRKRKEGSTKYLCHCLIVEFMKIIFNIMIC